MRFRFLTSIVLSRAGATAALASDNLILNGSFEVLADAVELRTGLLFVDRFASGKTAQWSAAFP